MARVALTIGVLSAHGLARTARLGPRGRRCSTWRDDRAFAEIVGPLASSLRWRLRTGRPGVGLQRALAAGSRTRAVGGACAAVGGLAAAASVLIVTLADVYTTPIRLAMHPFG